MGFKCADLEGHGRTLMLFCVAYRCFVGITTSVGQLCASGEVG
jgi:hypothetical protein